MPRPRPRRRPSSGVAPCSCKYFRNQARQTLSQGDRLRGPYEALCGRSFPPAQLAPCSCKSCGPMGLKIGSGGGASSYTRMEGTATLQWGRRSKTAEGPIGARLTSVALTKLQWGRRSKTAEGPRTVDTWVGTPGVTGFNGAAVRKRRRVRRKSRSARSASFRFNGAAVRKRRRGRVQWGTERCTTSGFNGAAVRKRRRAARTSYLGWLQLASMGPPFENGGGFAALRFKFNRSKSFNGAAVRKRRRVPTPHFSTFVISASMGPPFENGGGVSKQHAANVHVASASMGPPFENGGGVGLVPVKLTETSGFNGAAVRKRRRVA